MSPTIRRYRFDEEGHIHTLGGVPLIGTTTALSIISKPLTWWASGMACAKLGWLNPKLSSLEERQESAEKARKEIEFMRTAQYMNLLDSAYRAHADNLEKTASQGTDLHDQVEQWIKWKMGESIEPLFIDPRLKPFIEWSEKNVRAFLASEAHCYSERLWVGGITDFIYLDKDSRVVLADVKSSKTAYFSHFVQAGAYHIQIEEKGLFKANGDEIKGIRKDISAHAIFPFGGGFKEPIISTDIDSNKKAFEAALTLYKLKQNFEGEE